MRVSSINNYLLFFYFFLASFAASINEAVLGQGAHEYFSLSYLIVPFIIFYGLFSKNLKFKVDKDIVVILFVSLAVFSVSLVIHQGSLKILFYLILALAVSNISCENTEEFFIAKLRYLFIFVIVVLIIDVGAFYYSGGRKIDILNGMLVRKQEVTILFSIYFGLFFYLVFLRRVASLDFVCVISVVILSYSIGIKTVLLVIPVVVWFSIRSNRLKNMYALLLVVAVLLLFVSDFNQNPFIKWIFGSRSEMTVDEWRSLETLIIRLHILEINVSALFSSLSAFMFGYGDNPADGVIYVSENTWITNELGSAFESGVIYILAKTGAIGLFLFALLFSLIIRRSQGLFLFIFVSLVVSNIFQDNVSSTFWFFMGLALYGLRKREVVPGIERSLSPRYYD